MTTLVVGVGNLKRDKKNAKRRPKLVKLEHHEMTWVGAVSHSI